MIKNLFYSIVSLSLLTACTKAEIQDQSPLIPAVTVKEMMTGVIEPITNALWAVAMDENIPSTDEQWQALENQSIQLLSISSALSLGGSGPMDIAWSKEEKWQQHLQQMVDIGNQFLTASRTKNYQGLLDAGEILIEPCGSCHEDFPGESNL